MGLEKLESNDVKEIDWVKTQTKNALEVLKIDLDKDQRNDITFMEKQTDNTYNVRMDVVKKFLKDFSVNNYVEKNNQKERKGLTNTNSGALITAIQLILKDSGIDVGKIDGILGENTKKAIAKFQKENNVANSEGKYNSYDGIPGPKTIEAILSKIEEKNKKPIIPSFVPNSLGNFNTGGNNTEITISNNESMETPKDVSTTMKAYFDIVDDEMDLSFEDFEKIKLLPKTDIQNNRKLYKEIGSNLNQWLSGSGKEFVDSKYQNLEEFLIKEKGIDFKIAKKYFEIVDGEMDISFKQFEKIKGLDQKTLEDYRNVHKLIGDEDGIDFDRWFGGQKPSGKRFVKGNYKNLEEFIIEESKIVDKTA